MSAVDYSGNESALSLDDAVAVARPEVHGVQAIQCPRDPGARSGYAFATAQVLPWDMVATDVYYDYDQGVPYMVAYGDIVDMGPTRDLRDVPFAPERRMGADPGGDPAPGVHVRGLDRRQQLREVPGRRNPTRRWSSSTARTSCSEGTRS